MNGKERVDAVIKGKEHERVPVMCQLSMGHIIKNAGVPPAEFFLDYYSKYPEVLNRLTCKYEFDGVLLDYPPGYDPDYIKTQVSEIIDQNNGQLIVWENGDETFCPRNDMPIYRSKVVPKKKQFEDVEFKDLALIEGYKHHFSDLPVYYMKPFKDVLELMGNTHSVHSFVITPLSLFMHSVGIEDALIGLLENSQHSHKLLDALTEACIIWVRNIIDAGVHAVCVSSPFEGSGFISESMYREYGLPYTSRVVEYIRNREIPSYMHMCGSINDRLEAIVDTGVDGIECLDPAPIGNVELLDAVRRIGDKVFIKGNMDSVNTLLIKNQEEVYKDAAERIKIASGTGRFILSSACSVSPNTPSENLEVLVKAALDYGKY